MVKVALLARLHAKPGQEAELAALLEGALPLARAEGATIAWFAIKLGPSEYGVFDAFPDDAGRQAHLHGEIAKALLANADRLLAAPPDIKPIEVLAAKLP
jgi:quinol monooxygenase YgiN